MKFLAFTLAAMLGLAAGPVAADSPPADAPHCIGVGEIDHTQVVDDQTILFHLRGGETLRNTLLDRCVGLRLSTRGFTYVALNDEVCGNLQSIRVNDTGAICQLGPFTREPPRKPAQ
jgi:hypothetical protein